MPMTITLKNIPDDVYKALKESAERNRRSMNSEAIVCLERVLGPHRITVEDRLERIRRLRESLNIETTPEEIDRFKREGRK